MPLDPRPTPLAPGLPGRPVMVLRNDYVLKLFNGDIGITLPDATGDADGVLPRQRRRLPRGGAGAPAGAPDRLRDDGAQGAGSEFDEVLVLLPAQPSRVVTRELLYTAVTRARAGVAIVGGAEVIEKAIVSPTRRYSGLVARLKEAAQQQLPPGRSGCVRRGAGRPPREPC